jgi:hypothetical protein
VAFVNLPANLQAMFDDIKARLTKVENSQRFTLPNTPPVTSQPTVTGLSTNDPTYPRTGDMWLNATANAVRYVDAVGVTQSLYPTAGAVNYLINGAFDFWQRGASGFANNVYTADRWYSARNNTDVFQETSDLPTNFANGIRTTSNNGSAYGYLRQPLESGLVIPLRGSTVTVSGYVKVSAGFTGNLKMIHYYSTSSDALASQTTVNSSQTIATSATTTWTRFSVSFSIPSTAVGSMISLENDTLQPATGIIWRFAGLQMEVGSYATPFRRNGNSLTEELASCQRYYFRLDASQGQSNARIGVGMANGTGAQAYTSFPVVMRGAASPAFTYSGASGFSFYTVITNAGVSAISLDNWSPYGSNLAITLSSSVTANGGQLTRTGAANPCWVAWDCEL